MDNFLEEGMVDYERDTVASSIYDHPPATPPARDTARTAPNPFMERDEVPTPSAQRAFVDPASGVLHNTLGQNRAQYLQSVDDLRRQAQIVATANAHSSYRFTRSTVDDRILQTAGQSFATWITGPKAVTASAIAEREALRARKFRVNVRPIKRTLTGWICKHEVRHYPPCGQHPSFNVPGETEGEMMSSSRVELTEIAVCQAC
uniref:Uncharacterized protein n=1 Tax=Peronospora matthiolae TaxID=2874970 RepID=A0AAV1TG11_9STRA